MILIGYCVHVTLPLALKHSLHVISFYLPPNNNTIPQALSDYIHNLTLLNTPGNITHHFLLAGDTNRSQEPFLRNDLLNITNLVEPTHYSHTLSSPPSHLDDIYISRSLLTYTNTTLSSIQSNIPTDIDIPKGD